MKLAALPLAPEKQRILKHGGNTLAGDVEKFFEDFVEEEEGGRLWKGVVEIVERLI